MNYPKAIKGNQTDTYFGTAVADPYRDLENDSEATKKWVDEEVNTVRIIFQNSFQRRNQESVERHLEL
jgi:hypothetical protein